MSPASVKVPLHHNTVPPTSPPLSKADLKLDPASALQPATREWRRFLKKTHRLESIAWGGRGAVGTWRFERLGVGAMGIQVHFQPFGSKTGEGWTSLAEEEGGGGHGRRASVGGGSPVKSRRRDSEVSLMGTCLGGLNLTGLDSAPAVESPDEEKPDDGGWGLGLNLGAGAEGGLATSPRKAARKAMEKVDEWAKAAQAIVEPFTPTLGWAEPPVSVTAPPVANHAPASLKAPFVGSLPIAPKSPTTSSSILSSSPTTMACSPPKGRKGSDSPPHARSHGKRSSSGRQGSGGAGQGWALGGGGGGNGNGGRPGAGRTKSSSGSAGGNGNGSKVEVVAEDGWQTVLRK